MTTKDWPKTRLKNLVESVQTGIWGGEPDGGEDDVRVVRVADFDRQRFGLKPVETVRSVAEKDRSPRLLRVGDILLEKSGGTNANPVGFTVMFEGAYPAVSSNFIGRVRMREGQYPRFWLYALAASYLTRRTQMCVRQTTGIQNLVQGEFFNEVFAVPSLAEQRAIADYLDRETARIDTLIEEQQRLIDLLRERRRGVISAVFSAGRSTEPNKVGRLLAARPAYGVLVPTYVDETEGVPFIRVGDILNLSPERQLLAIPTEQSDAYSRTKLVGGEVLLGVVGKMGQAAIAPQWLAGANVNRAVAVLRCLDPLMAPLLCAWLGSDDYLRQAELATSGDSVQATLGMRDLAQFDINVPTDPTAAAELESRTAKIDQLIAETDRFIELSRERRSALITAAVTGQIDVREAA